MTIHILDGNNVMRRRIEKRGLDAGKPMSLRMMYEEACISRQIWVWDGYRHNERRREIYPKYKMNREPTPENIYAQIKLFREALRHAPVTQIEVAGWEADDIVGTLVRQYGTTVPLVVHTNDMDYGQISHLCTLNGVNMKGVPHNRIALYKALCGDKSDNIDGIPGFGPKRWEDLEPYWDQIQAAIFNGDPAGFLDLPFKPAVKAWLTSQENVDLLQNMLAVTHFDNVPADELEGGTVIGTLNRAEAHALLGRFFL